MKIEVVNAGKCMICGKPIKLAVPKGYSKLPNIFFCKECESKLKYDRKRPESEVRPLANGDWQYGNATPTVSYSDRTESEET